MHLYICREQRPRHALVIYLYNSCLTLLCCLLCIHPDVEHTDVQPQARPCIANLWRQYCYEVHTSARHCSDAASARIVVAAPLFYSPSAHLRTYRKLGICWLLLRCHNASAPWDFTGIFWIDCSGVSLSINQQHVICHTYWCLMRLTFDYTMQAQSTSLHCKHAGAVHCCRTYQMLQPAILVLTAAAVFVSTVHPHCKSCCAFVIKQSDTAVQMWGWVQA